MKRTIFDCDIKRRKRAFSSSGVSCCSTLAGRACAGDDCWDSDAAGFPGTYVDTALVKAAASARSMRLSKVWPWQLVMTMSRRQDPGSRTHAEDQKGRDGLDIERLCYSVLFFSL